MPHLAKIKAPFGQEKVYKEECAFSFDNPVSTNRMEKIVLLNRIEEHYFKYLCEYLLDEYMCTLYSILQETETGLYVCMSTFLGLGKKYVEWFYNKTGNAVFLHIRRIRIEVSKMFHDQLFPTLYQIKTKD